VVGKQIKIGTTGEKEGLMQEPQKEKSNRRSSDKSKRRFVRPFAPEIAPEIVDAILARGKEVPCRHKKVPRGSISGQEYYYKHYGEWLDKGIEIPGALLRRADRGLYQQLYSELGREAFPTLTKHKQRIIRHVRLG
jgi:hypothetical protein